MVWARSSLTWLTPSLLNKNVCSTIFKRVNNIFFNYWITHLWWTAAGLSPRFVRQQNRFLLEMYFFLLLTYQSLMTASKIQLAELFIVTILKILLYTKQAQHDLDSSTATNTAPLSITHYPCIISNGACLINCPMIYDKVHYNRYVLSQNNFCNISRRQLQFNNSFNNLYSP